jgi:hypothetical protein
MGMAEADENKEKQSGQPSSDVGMPSSLSSDR